ncbi:MAG: DUF134 domain-containing protein [Candidatus Schekmanbacteria bacterium]|nr:MAG: DUF134 domain-containing protein [Candidatus Schekmanbacteria bacterium]
MPRPLKYRVICRYPEANLFTPTGISSTDLDEVVLTLDEFEAINHADLDGMTQEEASKLMDISRQTFGRIIANAHRKIADALVKGKALRIEGGNYIMSERGFECSNCGCKWEEISTEGKPKGCPACCKSDIKVVSSHKCHGNHSHIKGNCCGKEKGADID